MENNILGLLAGIALCAFMLAFAVLSFTLNVTEGKERKKDEPLETSEIRS